MRVIFILRFRNGRADGWIIEGDCVRLREEYSRPGERSDLYIAKNMNEWSENIDFICITSKMVFKPIERVGIEMVEIDPDYSFSLHKVKAV